MISQLFDQTFIKVFRLMSPYSFSTPQKGSELSNREYQEIVDFRDSYYEIKLPHLTSTQTLSSEEVNQYDSRSFHFRVFNKKNELIGCLRLTPNQFETENFFSIDPSTKSHYLEISRLLAKPGHKGLTKTMLIHAGVYSVLKLKKTGFIALSRANNLSLFKKFGMMSQTESREISNRAAGQYHYIKSDFKQLRNKVIMHFFTNVKKRLTFNLKPQIAQILALIALSQLAYSL